MERRLAPSRVLEKIDLGLGKVLDLVCAEHAWEEKREVIVYWGDWGE